MHCGFPAFIFRVGLLADAQILSHFFLGQLMLFSEPCHACEDMGRIREMLFLHSLVLFSLYLMMSGSKGAFAKPGSSKSTNLKSKNEIDSSIAYLQKYIKNEMYIYGIFYGNIVTP